MVICIFKGNKIYQRKIEYEMNFLGYWVNVTYVTKWMVRRFRYFFFFLYFTSPSFAFSSSSSSFNFVGVFKSESVYRLCNLLCVFIESNRLFRVNECHVTSQIKKSVYTRNVPINDCGGFLKHTYARSLPRCSDIPVHNTHFKRLHAHIVRVMKLPSVNSFHCTNMTRVHDAHLMRIITMNCWMLLSVDVGGGCTRGQTVSQQHHIGKCYSVQMQYIYI